MRKLLFLFSLYILLFFPSNIFANSDNIHIEIETKNIQGAIAHIDATLQAKPENVWRALIDVNHHASIYPRIEKSFCLKKEATKTLNAQMSSKSRKDIAYNASNQCDPHKLRANQWKMILYQEIDYPFPLKDRWVVSLANHTENKAQQTYTQKGKAFVSNQNIHEFEFLIEPSKSVANQTHFKATLKSDPGGFIMSWMIKLASKKVLPEFVTLLEKEAQKLP